MFKLELQSNESVNKIYRQTEAVLFKPVLIIFILIYFPWYLLLKYELAFNYPKLLLFWTLLVIIYGTHKYILWLLNVYIITNKRLLNVNYVNLFNKKVTESPLNKILNVSYSSKGFWSTIFKFGTVETKVVGLNEPIMFSNVSKPSEVKDYLWELHLNSSK